MGNAQSMITARKLLNWYVNTTLLYGFGRAVTYDYEGTDEEQEGRLELQHAKPERKP